MRRPGPRATLLEIAAWVSSALSSRGIRAVLVGGAAVGAHTSNRYQSLDVDLATVADGKALAETARSLGFRRQGRVWVHSRFVPTLDFVSGPPAAGRTVFDRFRILRTRFGRVAVLTATQSTMDRLAAFYHWNDPQGLEQALLIAIHRKVDLKAIARWSAVEGMSSRYRQFRAALTKRRSNAGRNA